MALYVMIIMVYDICHYIQYNHLISDVIYDIMDTMVEKILLLNKVQE